MKKVGFLHLLPFFVAISLSYFFLSNYTHSVKSPKTIVISGISNTERLISAIGSNPNNQLALVEALSDKNAVTVFGSSELTADMLYIPYNLLPDSFNIRCQAFGHAYFQSFAIYCQLLAMKEYLQNSKIVVIISPGWFESDGTNIEAFLEHVRPEFLKRIIWDSSISIFQKKKIGNYIKKNVDQIDFLSPEIEYFDLLASKKTFIQQIKIQHIQQNFINNFKYHLKTDPHRIYGNESKIFAWEKSSLKLKSLFLESCKSNPYFISDSYYNQHIKTLEKFKKKEYLPLSIENNTELKDLLYLIRLLKKEKVKPIFIVQGLNPYYYDNLQKFNPILKVIKAECKKQKFPILDLFVDNEKDYDPGTLNDVMHMGDYGWLKVNRFLIQSFYE